jgi:hypothetical protein
VRCTITTHQLTTISIMAMVTSALAAAIGIAAALGQLSAAVAFLGLCMVSIAAQCRAAREIIYTGVPDPAEEEITR